MIAKNPDERRHYESRLKMQRDEQARLEAAEERGEARGEARGKSIGEAIGEERGKAIGKAIGRVQVLQSLTGHSESTVDQLSMNSLEDLAAMEQDLKQQLRDRG